MSVVVSSCWSPGNKLMLRHDKKCRKHSFRNGVKQHQSLYKAAQLQWRMCIHLQAYIICILHVRCKCWTTRRETCPRAYWSLTNHLRSACCCVSLCVSYTRNVRQSPGSDWVFEFGPSVYRILRVSCLANWHTKITLDESSALRIRYSSQRNRAK